MDVPQVPREVEAVTHHRIELVIAPVHVLRVLHDPLENRWKGSC